uniref:hypothetical protein n=1 Tax=Acetatifactor sp. TaxID=1872090 RepID=UPI004055BB71
MPLLEVKDLCRTFRQVETTTEAWYPLAEETPGVIKGDGKAEEVNVHENAGANYKCVDVLEVRAEIVYETAPDPGDIVWGRIDQGWILMDLVQLKRDAAADETAAATEAA